jgi:hypothetical protein
VGVKTADIRELVIRSWVEDGVEFILIMAKSPLAIFVRKIYFLSYKYQFNICWLE